MIKEEGVMDPVEIIKIDDGEQAVKLRFLGSPTIYIDGQDIDPPAKAHYAMVCRAYRLEDGRISPLPSLSIIRRTLRSAKERRALK